MFMHSNSSKLRSPHQLLGGIVLASVASACGQHFDLGEIAQGLDQNEPSSPRRALGGTRLLAGPGDLDVTVAGENAQLSAPVVAQKPVPLGDVDGDGFGDWISGDTLVYGGPRPDGDVLEPRGRARFRFDGHGVGSFEAAGDVNGDGLADILFGTGGNTVWVASDEPREPARRFSVDPLAGTLVFGRRERLSGDVDPMALGVAFGDRDDLASRFAAEFAADVPESAAYQHTALRSLGDLDRDGFADFVVTTTLGYGAAMVSRSESVSYVHYGAADASAIGVPSARLDANVHWAPAGDADGDGRGDLIWTSAGRFYLLPGAAARLSGELALDRAVPVSGIDPGGAYTGTLGDLDGDGFDEFVLSAETVEVSPTEVSSRLYLFYGAPGLLRAPLDSASAGATFETRLISTISALGDWDGDGRKDLVFTQPLWADQADPYGSLPVTIEAWLLRGETERFAGTYAFSAGRTASDATDSALWSVPAGDLDGDGFDDLLFEPTAWNAEGKLGILYGAPSGGLSPIY
jgi:hypothetical protein